MADTWVTARGSVAETETFLLLVRELHFLSAERARAALALIAENSKMLTDPRARLLESL